MAKIVVKDSRPKSKMRVINPDTMKHKSHMKTMPAKKKGHMA